MLSVLDGKFLLSQLNFAWLEKKRFNVSISKSKLQIGLGVFKKTCINLLCLNDSDQGLEN